MWRFRLWAATAVVLLPIVGVLIWKCFPGPEAVAPSLPPSPPPSLAAALSAIEQNDLQTGGRLLNAILADNPRHPEALLYRGQISRNAGDLEGAVRDWSAVPDDPPLTGGTARFLEGTAVLEQARARRAEQLFLRAIELHPNYVQPRERLLELYIVQMRRDEARTQMEAIRRMRPLTLKEAVFEMVAVDRVTTPDSGVSLTRSYLEADPDDRDSRLALARYLIEGEKYDEAISVLRLGDQQAPADPKWAGLLGEALAKSDRVDDAIAALSGWEEQRNTSPDLSRALGQVSVVTEDWPHAVECFSKVVEARPEDSAALYRLGQALQRCGEMDRAREILQSASIEDELQREALRIVWGDTEKTDHVLQILVHVAELLTELGRAADAVVWYERALVIDPAHAGAAAGLRLASQAAKETAGGAIRARTSSGPAIAASSSPGKSRSRRTGEELTAADPAQTRATIQLRDVHSEAGVEFVYFNGASGFKYLVESTGGGVGVIDYDADGWPDMYFTQGCRIPHDPGDASTVDCLYRNRGDGTFYDVAPSAGTAENRYGQGCAAADYDGDGFTDLFVANYGRNTFFHNNGDGTFSDVTEAAGLVGKHMSSSAALADLDNDGLLDLYIVNYTDSLKVCRNSDGSYGTCNPSNFEGEADQLLRNAGDGTFADVTDASGAVGPNGKGLGVVVADFNLDGRTDIYIANDTTPNFLFRNMTEEPGRLSFVEEGLLSGTALSGEGRAQAGMGIACADFDGNGWQDLHVTNFFQETNTLYLNQGHGMFADETRSAGLAAPTFAMLGFGTQAADFDLDGWPDLFVANGHIDDFRLRGEPWKMPPQLFQNQGAGRFTDVSGQSGAYFGGEYLGRGVARLDWNCDLLPDLAVVHQDRPVGLLINETPTPGHAVAIRLIGRKSNREGIGARLVVKCGDRVQHLEICGGDGFFATNDRRQLIGLGAAERVDQLEVIWPLGDRQVIAGLTAGDDITMTEGSAVPLKRKLAVR